MPTFTRTEEFEDWDHTGTNVRCTLCNTGFMHQNHASRHFDSDRHRKRERFIDWDNTGKMVRCNICNTGFMHKNCAYSHFCKRTHFQNADKQQQARIKEANLLCIAVEGESWKRNVKALVHDYVLENKGTMQEINNNIQKYSKMDKTSLLELAIIKASICNGVTFEDMQQVHDYHALDEAFNFFEFMEASRVTSGVEIIIPGVVDFLRGLPEW